MRLIPRDEKFFDMFAELAKRLTAAAQLVSQLIAEPHRRTELVSAVKAVEHEADNLTRDIISRINTSFVTPIDREDIHLLASRLDNVIDLLDGAARRIEMFRITGTTDHAKRLANVLTRAAVHIEEAVASIKKPKIVAERTKEIKLLEEEGDGIYHEAVGLLFDGAQDAIHIMKWKEMYDRLESAIDECEDVANVLESISIKHG